MHFTSIIFVLSFEFVALRCSFKTKQDQKSPSLVQSLQDQNDLLRSLNAELMERSSFLEKELNALTEKASFVEKELNKAEVRYGQLDQEMKTRGQWVQDAELRKVNTDLKSTVNQQNKQIANLRNELDRRYSDYLRQTQYLKGKVLQSEQESKESYQDKLRLLTYLSTLRNHDGSQLSIPELSIPAQPLQPEPVPVPPQSPPAQGVPVDIPKPPYYPHPQTGNWLQTHSDIQICRPDLHQVRRR